jgi:hypothetical protein
MIDLILPNQAEKIDEFIKLIAPILLMQDTRIRLNLWD